MIARSLEIRVEERVAEVVMARTDALNALSLAFAVWGFSWGL